MNNGLINKIHHVDVFDLIPKIEDESLNLVIADPPYGEENTGYGRNQKKILGNESIEINYRFLDEIYPKLQNNSSLYIFSNYKLFEKIKNYAIISALYTCRMICILVKRNIGMGFGFRNQYEVCLVLEKGNPIYRLNDMSNIWQQRHIAHDKKTHPHQKCYQIIRKIIMHSSDPGGVIFDGFMGSGTTAIACHKEGRDFIGSELDPVHYRNAVQKLEYIQSQKTLKWN